MPKLWDILSPLNKVIMARLYEGLKKQEGFSGVRFVPPKDEDERGIHLEAQLEDTEEMREIMEQPGRGAWHE